LNASIGIDATYQFKNSQNKTKSGYLSFSDTEISARFPTKWWGNESDDRELNVLSGTVWTNDNSLYMDVFPNSLVGESAMPTTKNDEEATTGLAWFLSNWWWISFLVLALLIIAIYLLMKQNRKMKRTNNRPFRDLRDEYYSY